jgi:putative ABC transport system permease protein
MGILASASGVISARPGKGSLAIRQVGFRCRTAAFCSRRARGGGVIVGVLVTVLASLRPAMRATRVPPIAAVREGAALPPGRFARYRPVGSAALGLLGFALILAGLFVSGLETTQILLLMGIGAVLVFVGVAFFSSQLVTPMAHVLGGPAAKLAGAPGILARENAMRNPQRTASTAAALMIGLALVTLVAMLAAAIRSSFFDAVDKLWTTDYAVTAQNNYSPIPVSVSEPLRQSPVVTNVVGVRAGQGLVFGDEQFLTAVDPGQQGLLLDWTEDRRRSWRLGADSAFVDEGLRRRQPRRGRLRRRAVPGRPDASLRRQRPLRSPHRRLPFGPVTISSATFDGTSTSRRTSLSSSTRREAKRRPTRRP